jgi:DNA-binding MarR family transcriptional regulator
MRRDIKQDEYIKLLNFRIGLRKFLRWSESEAEAAGITPAQHQLLLAIKGHAGDEGPSIGQLANYLLLKHHSVVGLADRAEEAGLISRINDPMDHRVVRLKISNKGERILSQLVATSLDELTRMGGQLERLWKGIDTPPPYATKGLRSAPTQGKAKKASAKKAAPAKKAAKKAPAKKASAKKAPAKKSAKKATKKASARRR